MLPGSTWDNNHAARIIQVQLINLLGRQESRVQADRLTLMIVRFVVERFAIGGDVITAIGADGR